MHAHRHQHARTLRIAHGALDGQDAGRGKADRKAGLREALRDRAEVSFGQCAHRFRQRRMLG
jgi:hypothetical protein